VRRVPLVVSRQHGKFSLRDIDIAAHQMPAAEGETPADENQINAAFDTMPLEQLTLLHDSVATAIGSARKIESTMREAAGSESSPSFDALTAQLTKMNHTLRARLAARSPAAVEGGDAGAGETSAASVSGGGECRRAGGPRAPR